MRFSRGTCGWNGGLKYEVDPSNTQSVRPKTALTIGNFDGVHLGHAALVRQCRSEVGEAGNVVVLAFDPHPITLLNPDAAPISIESFEIRRERLIALGADEVIGVEPTPELLAMSAQTYVDVVIDAHRPDVIVEGHDFHFGKRRTGTPTVLKELAALRGVRVLIHRPVQVALTDQSIVNASSTMTRWLLKHGRVRDAGFVLGRPHELVGSVVQGDQLGRRIGFRTANVSTTSMLPSDGVYSAIVTLPSGEQVGGAVNVGARPTVDGSDRRAEVHLFDDAGQPWNPAADFPEYGWEIKVELIGWIRDQIKFASIDVLSEQLARDVKRAMGMVEPMMGDLV